MRLLHVVASPRGERSASSTVAEAFLEAYLARRPDLEIDTLDVWAEHLPEFGSAAIGAKYKAVSGAPLDGDEAATRAHIDALVARFRAAERIVVGVPMWNWSLPYKLKQLIDLVCQRDELFSWDGEAYGPMLAIPRGLVVGVRGQDGAAGFTGVPPMPPDGHVSYVCAWLRVIGVAAVDLITVDHTWDDGAVASVRDGVERAQGLARLW